MLLGKVVAALCVFGSVTALPSLSPRDLTVPERAIRNVLDRMKPLDDAMKRIRNGVGDPTAQTMNLLRLDWDVLYELRESSRKIRAMPDLAQLEATYLLTIMYQLSTMASSIANSWITWKPMVVAANKEREVKSQLRDDADALSELADALNGKAPKASVVQALGSAWKSSLTATIDKAAKGYGW